MSPPCCAKVGRRVLALALALGPAEVVLVEVCRCCSVALWVRRRSRWLLTRVRARARSAWRSAWSSARVARVDAGTGEAASARWADSNSGPRARVMCSSIVRHGFSSALSASAGRAVTAVVVVEEALLPLPCEGPGEFVSGGVGATEARCRRERDPSARR